MSYLSHFLVAFMIVFLILYIGWMVYDTLNKKSKTLNEQEVYLKNRMTFVEQAEEDYYKKQQDSISDMAEKKASVERHYQHSVKQLEEARIMRETAENKMILFKKQINKLQSDLHQARQRAKRLLGVKRLAEKNSDAVE